MDVTQEFVIVKMHKKVCVCVGRGGGGHQGYVYVNQEVK